VLFVVVVVAVDVVAVDVVVDKGARVGGSGGCGERGWARIGCGRGEIREWLRWLEHLYRTD